MRRTFLRIVSMLDRRDERLARALRDDLGGLGLLVSWHRVDRPGPGPHARPWLARASCRAWPETVERLGPTRRHAILVAAEALRRLADEE